MQHILGEQGKQLPSPAPWAQNPAIPWGREIIAPSAALAGTGSAGAQHTEPAGLPVQSRQQQALHGNLKCNLAFITPALL